MRVTDHRYEWWVNTIPRFANYEFSTHGRIRNKRTGYILKTWPDRYGYQTVSLGNIDNLQVHRLILEAFVGPPEDDTMVANHIDADRSNNHILNLEWVTQSENIKWAMQKGHVNPMIGLQKAKEVNLKPVRIVELNQISPCVRSCAEFLGIHPNRVSRVLVGVRKGQLLHGYHIEYA